MAGKREGGLLIETTRDIPVGTELNVPVLFAKGGFEFIQISHEDSLKLDLLLGGRYVWRSAQNKQS
jgi:hypothetical protein